MQNVTTGSKPNSSFDRLSKDGKWRSFPKVPGLMQYVSTGTYFARVRAQGKLFRQNLETSFHQGNGEAAGLREGLPREAIS